MVRIEFEEIIVMNLRPGGPCSTREDEIIWKHSEHKGSWRKRGKTERVKGMIEVKNGVPKPSKFSPHYFRQCLPYRLIEEKERLTYF